MKNKKSGVIVLFLMILVLSASFVSAEFFGENEAGQVMQSIVDIVVGFFKPLLVVVLGGDELAFSELYLFERFILFVILVSLVFLSLKRVDIFKDNPSVLWIIAIAIPLIAIRMIDLEWLHTIFMQYEILGIVFTSLLPFIIYFLFLHNILEAYPTMRKIGWALFAVIYFFMAYDPSNQRAHTEVYFWTAFASIVFLFLDGTIRSYFYKQKIKYNSSKHLLKRQLDLLKERDSIVDRFGKDPDDWRYKRRVKEIDDELKEIHKELK